MAKNYKFSIIIPVKEINDYIKKFVPIILKQTYQNFEIIILPDSEGREYPELMDEKIRIIETGHIGPAKKRDIGARKSKGEILAFIDDDAYPDEKWLENALINFKGDVLGIGGPNLTPKESNFFQKLSGEALASYLVSGPVKYRYKEDIKKEINDFPSCNLFVEKKAFFESGGFDTGFWPGEDTKLCLELSKKGKILYDPEVRVYHHRRRDFKGYLQQIFSYSVHRGYFTKKYPETSRKISYFIPSLFILGLIIGSIASIFSKWIAYLYLFVLGIYLFLVLIEGIKTKKIFFILPFILLVFFTHVTYGIGFVIGLGKKELKSKYR